ncbi:MAG: squalene synthase HpnC [Bacteroidetes bacterium]|nr:squalene synthase HpnC [Bacteroidota bacterium]MCW5896427.1 squalene synthase HpnC [Bacteroidota bacterium]
MARTHYENFPVASFFLPKHLRPYVAAVYAFARTADDFADEGSIPPEQRLEKLEGWQRQLDECYDGNAEDPIFIALAEVVREKKIPKQLLSDLLTAFKMDVTTNRYATFDDLMFYCRHSANPVGRIVLHLFDDASERNMMLSDSICTALQLANFWQDIGVDASKGRIYIPLEDIRRFGYTETDLLARQRDERFIGLLKFEVERTQALFNEGRPLLSEATRRLRFELALTWHGGVMILRKIERQEYNVFVRRPTITSTDKFSIVMRSLFQR